MAWVAKRRGREPDLADPDVTRYPELSGLMGVGDLEWQGGLSGARLDSFQLRAATLVGMNLDSASAADITYDDVVVLVDWMAQHEFTPAEIALAVAKPWNHRDWMSLAQRGAQPDEIANEPTAPVAAGWGQVADAIRRRGYPNQLPPELAGGILAKWGLPLPSTSRPVVLDEVAVQLANVGVSPYAAEHDLPRHASRRDSFLSTT